MDYKGELRLVLELSGKGSSKSVRWHVARLPGALVDTPIRHNMY